MTETSPEVKRALGDAGVTALLLKILEKHGSSSTQPQLGAESLLMTLGRVGGSRQSTVPH